MQNGRNGKEAVSKASFLSFLRMQESPKVALEGDSCIRRDYIFVKYVAFETASRKIAVICAHAGIPFE
ncbi:MAG: hypothetical protein NT007_05060 [Candidatus Kapabacteria bacterium]|nr:hypothetical protein [Candidatus Kapabacteria bacterium]